MSVCICSQLVTHSLLVGGGKVSRKSRVFLLPRNPPGRGGGGLIESVYPLLCGQTCVPIYPPNQALTLPSSQRQVDTYVRTDMPNSLHFQAIVWFVAVACGQTREAGRQAGSQKPYQHRDLPGKSFTLFAGYLFRFIYEGRVHWEERFVEMGFMFNGIENSFDSDLGRYRGLIIYYTFYVYCLCIILLFL